MTILGGASLLGLTLAGLVFPGAKTAAASSNDEYGEHYALNCARALCTEVKDYQHTFGYYVGHDEPSLLWYSDQPGSGNRAQWNLSLPTDPNTAAPNERSYQFELNGAFWFGMALCASESYPEQTSKCTPDSDSNIVDPSVSADHAGTAFVELQFYPPGWVKWPTWEVAVGASSCDPHKWCAALNIDSLAENPVNGTTLNNTCADKVGLEYVNFAFITLNGVPQASPNPIDATTATYTPDPSKDLFMSSGDNVRVSMADSHDGLHVIINDLTNHKSGSMTASAANGFAQVKYTTNPSTECTAEPYDFHPMYSTSSEQTRVPWAAHSYNVSFADEIGHFQFCHGSQEIDDTEFGVDKNGNPIACPKADFEELGANSEPSDSDDLYCFPARQSSLVQVSGCTYTNTGFDGASYQPIWPNGNTNLYPSPIRVSSPQTGDSYTDPYPRAAFEADLPAIEFSTCNTETGSGCTLIPEDDDGEPAAFYPWYSDTAINDVHGVSCEWQIGNHIPGSLNDFGENSEWGNLLQLSYTAFGGGGSSVNAYEDFRNVLSSNPC